jgi:hypothetical protein
MSFLSKIFGGGSKSTTTIDGFKSLPPFMQDLLEKQAAEQQSATIDMGQVRKQLADPNRSIAPLSSVEAAGLNAFTNAQPTVDRLAGDAASRTRGMDSEIANIKRIDPSRAVNSAAAGLNTSVGSAIANTQGAGAPGLSGDLAAMRGVNVDAFGKRYENDYINSVVDTTLGRIDEDLARRIAESRLKANRVGGMNNTRQAVAEAVDTQLSTREKAATEADLRSRAFELSRQLGLQRGAFETGRADTAGRLALDSGRFNLDRAAQIGDLGIRRGTALADIALEDARFGVRRGETAAGLGLEQAGMLSNLANNKSARALTEGSFLNTYGEKLRGLDQARLDAPRDALSWFATVSTNPNTPNSTSQTVSNSGGNTWAQIAGGALGAYQLLSGRNPVLSDPKSKKNVEDLDGDDAIEILRGLDPKMFEYKEGYGQQPGKTAGFMAPDVEEVLPGAVAEGPDGLKRIDPGALAALVSKALQQLEGTS